MAVIVPEGQKTAATVGKKVLAAASIGSRDNSADSAAKRKSNKHGHQLVPRAYEFDPERDQ
jgi:hypothetical protein